VAANLTFEGLCILASREGWCWRIPCTTCRNEDFRLALRELSEGRLSEEWRSLATTRRALQQRLGHLDAFRPWPLAVQRALVERIAPANLAEIARQGRFPDWLGFLGIALQVTEVAEELDRLLTRPWAKQLHAMLPDDEQANPALKRLVTDQQSVLAWRDLELFEEGLKLAHASSAPESG